MYRYEKTQKKDPVGNCLEYMEPNPDGNWTFRPFISSPLDVSPTRRFAPWTHSLFPSHYTFFIIVKLLLTTFVKANDDEDPAYSVKTQTLGAKRHGGETSRGRTDEGAKRP